jgi:putative mycofactocin binding protein MftB
MLDRAFALHPQVALRPEPFGALAYHYGNRKLVFLKNHDMVRVVSALADHATLRDAFVATGIAEVRWPLFERAVASLVDSEMLGERSLVG